MGMWMPVPHKPAKLLRRNYKRSYFVCSSSGWNHKSEAPKPARVSVPCRDLSNAYVVISRHKYGNGTLERVYLAGKHRYSVKIDEHIDDATFRMD